MRPDPNCPHLQRFDSEEHWPQAIDTSTRAIADAITTIINAARDINDELAICRENIDLEELRNELISTLECAAQHPLDMSFEGVEHYIARQLERLVAPSDYRPVRRIRVAPPVAADAGEGV